MTFLDVNTNFVLVTQQILVEEFPSSEISHKDVKLYAIIELYGPSCIKFYNNDITLIYIMIMILSQILNSMKNLFLTALEKLTAIKNTAVRPGRLRTAPHT